jgi:choline kinase
MPQQYDKLFILLSAGPSRRMHPYKECKYLVNIQKEPLITRQIRIIEDVYPNARIHVGLGECADEIKTILPRRIQKTVCKDFDNNNSCSTLKQCLIDENKHMSTTVINGDILFNHAAIENIDGDQILIVDKLFKKEDIGCNLSPHNCVEYIQYGLPNKFGQMFTFSGSNHQHVLNCLAMGDKNKCFLHELINKLSESYFPVYARKNKHAIAFDIDTCRDYKYIKKEINESKHTD